MKIEEYMNAELKTLVRKNKRLSLIVKALIWANLFILILNIILVAL